MSKSRGRVVNPDEYVARYGADVLRLYLLFIGPFERGGDFRDRGIHGPVRFVQQAWRLAARRRSPAEPTDSRALRRTVHQAIAKVTADIDGLAFNTAIATLMGLANTLQEWRPRASDEAWEEAMSVFLRLLAPLAPHLAEETWERQGRPYSVHRQPWPVYDPAIAAEEQVTLVVQVNGRVRARIDVPTGLSEEEATRLATEDEGVRRALGDRPLRRVVHVPDRIINLVA